MATATIQFPEGQNARAGGKIKLKIRYTGSPPPPNDAHFYVKNVGDSSFPDNSSAGWDIDSGKVTDPGLDWNWPVGSEPGSYDFRVVWTWKTPGETTKQQVGVESQYFVRRKLSDAAWCTLLLAVLMAIGGWVGGFALGPSLIGWGLGLLVGAGLAILICIVWHWLFD
jgi:hypothetical protein